MNDGKVLSEEEIIAEAIEKFGEDLLFRISEDKLLSALESFYMNGSSDEVCGDVNEGGHYYRVNRWIVQTDSQGFHEIFTFDTEAKAIDEFRRIENSL